MRRSHSASRSQYRDYHGSRHVSHCPDLVVPIGRDTVVLEVVFDGFPKFHIRGRFGVDDTETDIQTVYVEMFFNVLHELALMAPGVLLDVAGTDPIPISGFDLEAQNS